jgi:hypothetical protein
VISNDGWEHVDSDIWSARDYAPTGASLTERYGSRAPVAATLADRWPGPHRVVLDGAAVRGQPVVLSEFGGLTYAPRNGDVWLGYGTVQTAEELERRLGELVGAVCASDALAGFCYTQLTDTEQERNRLTYADRSPKLPPTSASTTSPTSPRCPGAPRRTARRWPAWSTAGPPWWRRGWPPWPAGRSTSGPAAARTSTPPRWGGPSRVPCWCTLPAPA